MLRNRQKGQINLDAVSAELPNHGSHMSPQFREWGPILGVKEVIVVLLLYSVDALFMLRMLL